MKVLLNGRLIAESEAVLPVSDKAYFFDFCVYESLKVVSGKVFFSEYHVDRLFDSAKVIGLGHSFSKAAVVSWIEKVVEANSLIDAFLRVLLIGDADANKDPKLFVFPLAGVTFYPKKFYSQGVKTISFSGERLFPNAKTKDLLLGFVALRAATKAGALEALLVDADGNVREGTRSNVFAFKGNKLFFPPKEKVLEGVTKKILLKVCAPHFELVARDLPLKKIGCFDEVFISSTLFNALPVRQVDDVVFAGPFEKTKRVQKLFRDYYHAAVLDPLA
ncbi:MAG: aminotransferase class IV [Candidatus Diapherotrites archaeon]|uniref:Aminotransferase class IV n=1 Tax=Candidatus Iainarchaeum sp. TaxID=3101447 RepID=A0A8T4L5E0_9ARCH|nr:aminotransferase class IV [Candidatus Diapherotrites archaeon]